MGQFGACVGTELGNTQRLGNNARQECRQIVKDLSCHDKEFIFYPGNSEDSSNV